MIFSEGPCARLFCVFKRRDETQVRVLQNTFYAAFDRARLDFGTAIRSQANQQEDYRTPFQIDRDRVLHTPTFRSLQSKTQVFWSGEYDFYRTRLTHSLEVAQIGRGICDWLKSSSSLLRDDFYIDSDLVDAVCLSHDLGHPPFGHAGERSLNGFMGEFGGFEGNAQTLRLLTSRIFTESRRGMNPSRAFLDGVLKYKTLWGEIGGAETPPEHHFIYDSQSQFLDFAMDGRDFPAELTPGKSRDSFKSIECQIMDWADDTAYSLHDLADAVRAGFLSLEKVRRWSKEFSLNEIEREALERFITALGKGRMDSFTGTLIGQHIRSTSLVEDSNFLSGESSRYRFRLKIDDEVEIACKLYKKLAYEVVFQSPELKQLEYKGSYVLNKLWSVLRKRYVDREKTDGQFYQLLPEIDEVEIDDADEPAQRARLVCDHLASLTDRSAVRLYRRLFEPGFGSIGDLV